MLDCIQVGLGLMNNNCDFPRSSAETHAADDRPHASADEDEG